MDEYLGGDGIAVVEWPGRCPDAVPESAVRIRMTAAGENERLIESDEWNLEDETACD
jgi:tRNA threonylcarbamoyladenosine biosynthesis protein TsaE